MSVISQMENPAAEKAFLRKQEEKEEREGDVQFWAARYKESIEKLSDLVKKEVVRKDDSGMGEAAYNFIVFLHERNCTTRSRKLEELFKEYLKETGSPYQDFNLIEFLAKKFEKEMEQ